jgi:hypothetical protein
LLKLRQSLAMEMDLPMAWIAKRDQVLFHIASQTASRVNMMDLKILRTSASLASPAIAFKHLLAKRPIGIPVQSKPGLSWDG